MQVSTAHNMAKHKAGVLGVTHCTPYGGPRGLPALVQDLQGLWEPVQAARLALERTRPAAALGAQCMCHFGPQLSYPVYRRHSFRQHTLPSRQCKSTVAMDAACSFLGCSLGAASLCRLETHGNPVRKCKDCLWRLPFLLSDLLILRHCMHRTIPGISVQKTSRG